VSSLAPGTGIAPYGNRQANPLSAWDEEDSMVLAKARQISAPLIGASLLALALTGCGTATGAVVGAGSGAAIGAGTGYGAGKGALIGTGVGAAAGAIYDIVK
jgi:hypothetical protein